MSDKALYEKLRAHPMHAVKTQEAKEAAKFRQCPPLPPPLPPGAHLSPVPPPLPMSSPASLRTGAGAPPAPPKATPPTAQLNNPQPHQKMLMFTAAKIPTWLIDEKPTVWSKPLPAILFDKDQLEAMFKAVEPQRSDGKAPFASKHLEPELVTLLDPTRENDCGIALACIKLPHAQIIAALLALDPYMLNPEPDEAANLIELLQVCSPTPDERVTLLHYDEGHRAGSKEHLCPVDKFFLQLILGVGDDTPERLKCVHEWQAILSKPQLLSFIL